MLSSAKSKIKSFVQEMGILPERKRRKICFIITNRIHLARQELLLKQLAGDPEIELQLVVGGSALVDRYGSVMQRLDKLGISVQEQMMNVIEGGNHVAMAKTAGLTVLELANTFQKLNPDIVLIRGDRFEQLAAAMTAAYLNKTVAHIEGGDVTGTIDESVRHAITKLSHIHLVTNDAAYRRVLQMGENPEYVFNVGSPDIEFALHVDRRINADTMNIIGVGRQIDFSKPYIIVIQHPVTSERNNEENVLKTLEAVSEIGIQTFWFWPNPDAGTDDISGGIRRFREQNKNSNIRFIIDVDPWDFIALLKNSKCLAGNSSAGIKEASFLGTPVVNIGTRQNGRAHGENIMHASYDRDAIKGAINKQINHGPYASSMIYHKSSTSKEIRNILKTVPLYTQKKFNDRAV